MCKDREVQQTAQLVSSHEGLLRSPNGRIGIGLKLVLRGISCCSRMTRVLYRAGVLA